MERNPIGKKGVRYIDCEYYDDCLEEAADEGWKSFSCEACAIYASVQVEDESSVEGRKEPAGQAKPPAAGEKRMCAECQQRPTISPGSKYCPRCMAVRGNQKRWKKGKPAAAKAASKPAPLPTPSAKSPAALLTLDFGRHARVIECLARLAEKEMRSIEMQALFMLVQQFQQNGSN